MEAFTSMRNQSKNKETKSSQDKAQSWWRHSRARESKVKRKQRKAIKIKLEAGGSIHDPEKPQ